MRLTHLDRGVCAAQGFRAAGVACGIKRSGGLDLAVILSDRPASAAGVFTTNACAAAPVVVSRLRVAGGEARGVVVNSGCANAATGARGIADAESMAEEAARLAGVDPQEMLVSSTGRIGSHLPMDKVRAGIREAVAQLKEDDEAATGAIMTTDTRPKRAAVAHPDGWSLGGIAKGAGMIAPRMATMLAFLATDAQVGAGVLQGALAEVVERTFNAVTVDGDTSTNDTVLLFANGASSLPVERAALVAALDAVCGPLAEAIVADGEGATKVVRVRILGATDEAEAKRAARAVAESLLVKTALYGEDPNWGRVAAALGKAAALPDFERLAVSIGGVTLLEKGAPAGTEAVARARAAMRESEIEIVCDLGSGTAAAGMLTTDLTPEYVRLNAEYET